MPTPHETLGVAPNASIEEVRAAYIQLARRHHPDKHGHATEEERARNEAIFKEVTNAYQLIAERPSYAQASGNGEEAWRVPTSLDEWESTWNKVINVPEVMNTMKSLFNMARQMREARQRSMAKAAEAATVPQEPVEPVEAIHATLQVTPADVQGMRKRKIRVMPSGMEVLVDCGAFPGPFRDAEANVEVAFEIVSKDAHVTVDSFEPGKWDLFRRVSVNLMQWLEGSVHALPHVCKGSADLTSAALNVVIPPCTPLDTPLIFDDLSQWRYGSIYVSVALDLPTQDAWLRMGEPDRECLATLLRTLSQPAPVP